jgi:hypothetical protein
MGHIQRQNPGAGGGIVSDRIEAVPPDTDDDETTVQLLRAADPRASMSLLRTTRVRSATRSAWRLQVRRRVIRRRVVIVSSLLGATVLGLVLGRGALPERDAQTGAGVPVAVVVQVNGPSRIQRRDTVRVGEWIQVAADSRVSLRFGDRTSVRLDTGTRMRALSPNAIELAAGAVYVDSASGSGGFEVRTTMGAARDVGTQFEVRLFPASLRVRVRTGMVQLTDKVRSISGRQGTEITLSATGAATRRFDGHDSGWDWVTRVAPPLEMEGMSLAAFLEGAARERGWAVVYPNPTLARDAKTIVLHGSVSGLSFDEAIGVAVATSGLRYRVEEGSLFVLDGDRSPQRDTSP